MAKRKSKFKKPMSKWHPKYWGIYPLLGLIWLLAQLPYRLRLRVGRGLGWVYYGLSRHARHIAMTNLRLCFPELSDTKRRVLCRQSFMNLAAAAIESTFMRISDKFPLEQMLASIDGYEHILAAKQQGRGVVILFPHLTPVFFVGYLCWRALDKHDFGFMYQPSRNPVLAERFAQQFMGEAHAFTRRNAKQMLTFLQSGGAVWYSPDLIPRRQDRVYVPFFGVRTSTGTAPMRFAKISGALVLAIGFTRDTKGRFHIRFQPPLTDFPSDDVNLDATRVNSAMAEQIAAYPDAYLWSYRRFNKPPPGEVNPYK
jgi:KDO2-lipid IV(A) lauroyltransferase